MAAFYDTENQVMEVGVRVVPNLRGSNVVKKADMCIVSLRQ